MIKAEELRIGDLFEICTTTAQTQISLPTGRFGVISEIRSDKVQIIMSGVTNDKEYKFNRRFDNINPIPLTEEWLVKFGFKKSDEGFVKIKLKKKGSWLELNLKDKRTLVITGHYFNDFVNVKHVHQLQNLYFALTGQELTLKKD